MMNNSESVISVFETFLSSCPESYFLPIGDPETIPLDQELKFVEAVEKNLPLSPEIVSSLRKRLLIPQSYYLLVFSLRLSVLAVRTKSKRMLSLGLIMFFIDDENIDWRDALRALAIMEDCSNRLKVEFKSLVSDLKPSLSEKQNQLVFGSYFERPIDMRSLKVMAYEVRETKDGLSYANKM